ncbi:MAG: NACHT domain-containing protein [Chloroflexi bacterium]|nr:NACHT domain-containing protein [Chloroflexota bacterium]
MITTKELLDHQLLENPFQRYADTRFFYPNLGEQRKVLEVAFGFINDQKDPSKNLGVIAGSAGSGKSMLAYKLSQIAFSPAEGGQTHSLYLNTNTITEPRHFLMAVIETLGLPSSRSNTDRIESIFNRLEESNDQLLLVLDGPPVDQDYLTQLSDWSVEHNKKIKTLVFLQDINNTTANIGSLNQFLGLYVPFRSPSVTEIAALLYWRCLMAGQPEPFRLIPESGLIEIAEASRGSLTEAIRLANDALESHLAQKNTTPLLSNFLFRQNETK